jgi:hypothetical protein
MRKLIPFLFISLLLFATCVSAVSVNILNLPNGKKAFNSVNGSVIACGTSDSEILIMNTQPNTNESYWYQRVDSSSYSTVVSKKKLYDFPINMTYMGWELACDDSNNAYLISVVAHANNLTNITDYYNNSIRRNKYNITGYSYFLIQKIDSSGNLDYSILTDELDHIAYQLGIEMDDYIQVVYSSADEPYEKNISDISQSEVDLRYMYIDKSDGDIVDSKIILSNAAVFANIIGDGSNNLYLIYNKFAEYPDGSPPNPDSDVFFAKINSTGDFNSTVSQVQLNTNSAYTSTYADMNDIDIDSSGNLHTVWIELNESNPNKAKNIWYAKLQNNGTILTKQNLKNVSTNGNSMDLNIFLKYVGGSVLDFYYSTIEFSTIDEQGGIGYDGEVNWMNLSTSGSMNSQMQVLDNYMITYLGAPCCESCDGECPCLTSDEYVPEFENHKTTLVSILLIFIIAVIVLAIISKQRRL